MTLVVDFAGFVDAVRRYGVGGNECVYTTRKGETVHLTYVNPQTGVQIVSFLNGSEDAARAKLDEVGLGTAKGTWVTEASLEHLAQLTSETYVAAVAYDTRKGPGLWVDSYPFPPTEGGVLRAIFDEFVSEGILDERAFEQFIHDAKPVVRILEPVDLERFIKQKSSES